MIRQWHKTKKGRGSDSLAFALTAGDANNARAQR